MIDSLLGHFSDLLFIVNGDVYTWGDRDTNRLGHTDITGYVHLPKLNQTLSGKGVVQLSHARGNEAAVTGMDESF